ncbi:hypothetical protein TIFTF001_014078 [Ficus carica]|uniref:Uncharacterized protein n=1 Tax=Ficus carica TaxID=3494 RepID=A0AA88AFE5_FICCA|nr:hypothetical protein TIFTF001_014078 [Ficus carica]
MRMSWENLWMRCWLFCMTLLELMKMMSRGSFKLMHFKVLYKWPNECMDAMWKLLKDAFPDRVNLPNSHYESKTKLGKHWGIVVIERGNHERASIAKPYRHTTAIRWRYYYISTQQPQSLIDNWGDMHHRGPNWVNSQAELTFNLMEGDRATHMSQSASGLSSFARTIPGVSSSSRSQSKCLSLSQLPSEYQSWINRLEVNHKNIYANQMTMRQTISELLPKFKFALVIPPKDFVPPCPSTNPSSLPSDDDNEAANLGN